MTEQVYAAIRGLSGGPFTTNKRQEWFDTIVDYIQRYMRLARHWTEIEQKRLPGTYLGISEAVKLIAKPKPVTTGNTTQGEGVSSDDTPEAKYACTSRTHCPELPFRPEGTCWIPDSTEDKPNARLVDEVARIIEEIERLSAETVPVFDVHPLTHVGSESLVDSYESPEDTDSAGTWLRSRLLGVIEEWRIEYPDSPASLVGGVLGNLAAEQ
jgi:hypothetical protein